MNAFQALASAIATAAVTISASASYTSAPEAVSADARRLSEILKITSQKTKMAQMCNLIEVRADLSRVASQILGDFSKIASDQEGVERFGDLIGSILATEFEDILGAGSKGAHYTVSNKASNRGSGTLGVKVQWGGKQLEVLVNRFGFKITDVLWTSLSLVKDLRGEYQAKIKSFRNKGSQTPVSDLVDSLIASGNIVRCR